MTSNNTIVAAPGTFSGSGTGPSWDKCVSKSSALAGPIREPFEVLLFSGCCCRCCFGGGGTGGTGMV